MKWKNKSQEYWRVFLKRTPTQIARMVQGNLVNQGPVL